MRRRTLLVTLAIAVLLLAGQGPAQGQSSAPAMAMPAFSPVGYDRLVNADQEPGNWLMYSGQYNGQRYSRLDQIRAQNAARLRLKWAHQLRTLDRAETTPLVVDSVMYVTESPSTVIALDAKTGRQFWRYEHEVPSGVPYCCGRNNRGVAILGDQLFMSTLDAHLVALDAKTGNVIWNVEVIDHQAGYSKTAAPLVVKNMVVTGIAGGDYGIRGFIDAYDAETGSRVWRFYTIPAPGEPGNETWEGDSWKTGGSATWVTGSFDPELNLVYWGTGNPGPDFNGEDREGDNLYSNCVLALDADSGELRWYFQFTPHDVWDWDAAQTPVLVDAAFDGQPRKLMVWANRNAFFYVLDRETGEFLLATPFAKQTWAERIDDDGRPIFRPGIMPSAEGTLVAPPVEDAANWWSTSYSPKTGLLYVMTHDAEELFFVRDDEYVPGELYEGGSWQRTMPIDNYVAAVRAIVLQTGERKWEHRVQPRGRTGLLSTAGDLVFGGTVDGYFFALDARTGEDLWHMNIGGRVQAAPITYLADGDQYVTIAAGNNIFTFGLEP